MTGTKVKTALRAALSNKKLADDWLAAMAEAESSFIKMATELDSQSDGSIDTSAMSSIVAPFDADEILEPNASALSYLNKSDSNQQPASKALNLSYRKYMRSAMSSKAIGDVMVDMIAAFHSSHNAAYANLDASQPNLVTGSFVSGLTIPADFDVDAPRTSGQDRVSLRKAMRSRLANKKLADMICDHLQALHGGMKDLMALLDADNTSGNSAALAASISVIDPEAAL